MFDNNSFVKRIQVSQAIFAYFPKKLQIPAALVVEFLHVLHKIETKDEFILRRLLIQNCKESVIWHEMFQCNDFWLN